MITPIYTDAEYPAVRAESTLKEAPDPIKVISPGPFSVIVQASAGVMHRDHFSGNSLSPVGMYTELATNIVLKNPVEKSSRFAIVGESAYEVSIFARILLQLSLAVKTANKKDMALQSDSEINPGRKANNEQEAEYVGI